MNLARHLCKRYTQVEDEGERILQEFLEVTQELYRMGWPEDLTILWWKWAHTLSPWRGDLAETRGPKWEMHCALVRLCHGLLKTDPKLHKGFNTRFTDRQNPISTTKEAIQRVHDLSDTLGIPKQKMRGLYGD